MPPVPELREKRVGLVKQARDLMDKAGAAKRDLTAEEQVQVDKIWADVDALKVEIETEEKRSARFSRLEREESELAESRGRATPPARPGDGGGGAVDRRKEAVELKFAKRGFRGRDLSFRFTPGTNEHRRCQEAYVEACRAWIRGDREARALQTDLDSAGGYITMPEQFLPELLKDLDDQVLVRSLARKFTITAQTLGIPTRQSKMASFGWGQELTAPVADTALKFGKRTLTPHYMTGEILVSRDLLRAAVMDPEAIVNEEIARDAGELEEQAFISGDGAQKPLGLFTASGDGISTSRDVSTDNTATAFTVDGLMNAFYSLKPTYRKNAQWMFHRDAVKMLRKLKDGNSQYLWHPATGPSEPDTFLSRGIQESEWVPNTFTTGLYVGIIGDFNYYWIVDSLSLELQVLIEKYAETNQNAYLARRKVDGMPVREQAFARVKLG